MLPPHLTGIPRWLALSGLSDLWPITSQRCERSSASAPRRARFQTVSWWFCLIWGGSDWFIRCWVVFLSWYGAEICGCISGRRWGGGCSVRPTALCQSLLLIDCFVASLRPCLNNPCEFTSVSCAWLVYGQGKGADLDSELATLQLCWVHIADICMQVGLFTVYLKKTIRLTYNCCIEF